MLGFIELLLLLLVVLLILDIFALKIHVPFPIVMVLAGVGIGFLPGVLDVRLDPDLVFFFFLPPLLYSAAVFTDINQFKKYFTPIMLLAVGAVFFTTLGVGLIVHYAIGLPWLPAFLLGAILSPPDAIAATTLFSRMRIPKRLVTILEGESLVNDASALIAFKFATTAVLTGTFSLLDASIQFGYKAIGGAAIGLVLAWLISTGRAYLFKYKLANPVFVNTISLMTPYIAYIAAETITVSGVLSVVAAGLFLGWRTPKLLSATARIQSSAVWGTYNFILNGLVFILMGLQIPFVMNALNLYPTLDLILYATLTSLAVFITRPLWVYPSILLHRLLSPKHRRSQPIPWKDMMIISWAGMRGVVSLAAAMAIPLVTLANDPFPHRDLIIFLSFWSIVTTLVIQGFTLPIILKAANFQVDDSPVHDESKLRLEAAKVGNKELQQYIQTNHPDSEIADEALLYQSIRIRTLEDSIDRSEDELDKVNHLEVYYELRKIAINAERKWLFEQRSKGLIDTEVFLRLQSELDHEELALRGEPKKD